ncbi:hypothetical protein [Aureibaculum conchae]|uniref:hypothetical protein n=1 Tax=Aureibaculum sp. 2308TA14-22 TaxID=3108392 RepID=UPI003398A2E9
MTKQVVKYNVKLFYIKRALTMIFSFQLNQGGVLKKVQKMQKGHHINFYFLNKILVNLRFPFIPKLELAYISTQGIVNIDVIDKTKPRKLVYLSSKIETFNHLTNLCIGYTYGMLTIKNVKTETQPLNMVLSKTK